jgi:deoxycytidylate deaminase
MDLRLIQGINYAYAVRSEPLVFALTGRTGSGCTTAASMLSKDFSQILLTPGDPSSVEYRKLAIATEYARAKWEPFAVVTVSSVIFSFLLHEESKSVDRYLTGLKLSGGGLREIRENIEFLTAESQYRHFDRAMNGSQNPGEMAEAWKFYLGEVHVRAQQVKRVLGTTYATLFQGLGDNVRLSGAPLDATIRPEKLFTLMERVCRLIDCYSVFQSQGALRPSRIAIDAIRNPLELVFLRRRLAGLYVIAITADDAERKGRLVDLGLSKKDIERLDAKEYPLGKYLQDYNSFVSQNLKDCIQKSDIFVANPGVQAKFASSVGMMNTQLVRYVALALRPGLITPTRDERCMQIAFVAKLNSGCISRQVGAVVADQGYSIHALGWNDTPKGQTPCLLRDIGDLLGGDGGDAFSEFEKNDPKLRSHLESKFKNREVITKIEGQACPFCFKDAYNAVMKDKNQVHTRSLHAEENAFLQAAKRGSAGIGGGVLYTTASPCELCSKKAYQLGIKEIVYVDPYPGISATHVLRSGDPASRPQLRLFSGAVGSAYHRLYEALLSIKDELAARMGNTPASPEETASTETADAE